MSSRPIDPEMRRRFESAERIRVSETTLRRPSLRPSIDALRAHFAGPIGQAQTPLANPHLEPKVARSQRANAVPASVLLPIVMRESGPRLVVTLRHENISHPGHWVFPGGRSDDSDATPIDTALREAREEIGLEPHRVEILGRLGDYYSHSGFRIAPAVALVRAPAQWAPQPGEVEEVAEIDLFDVFDSSRYMLYRFPGRPGRAHFALNAEAEDIMLTGVTASICIGLYAELLKTQSADPSRAGAAGGWGAGTD